MGSLTSYGLWDLEVLDTKDLEGAILNEENKATFSTIKALPQSELDRAGEVLLRGDVLDRNELFKLPDNIVIGENTALVLTLVTVGDQTALVECYHDVGATSVHCRPQCPSESHLQCLRSWLLECCLWCSFNLISHLSFIPKENWLH